MDHAPGAPVAQPFIPGQLYPGMNLGNAAAPNPGLLLLWMSTCPVDAAAVRCGVARRSACATHAFRQRRHREFLNMESDVALRDRGLR
mmetsp:Transcript_136832/g.241282  ORF Transcript_136832/g.241282 Transcript_136832/m.241282 type:complete len:88 (+) Transcript_136832:3-266(+)